MLTCNQALATSLSRTSHWAQTVVLWLSSNILILTCQRRKSLRRTSPEVRMSRSGFGELLLYKHSLSNDSETSLWEAEQHNQDPVKDMAPRVSFLLNIGCWFVIANACLPCFYQALLHSPSHFSDCIGDFISRCIGKTHIEETSTKQAFMNTLSFTKCHIIFTWTVYWL